MIYLTIHCKLPGNPLNLIPDNFSWKPFDLLGVKVGIGQKGKLKQIFIKISVHITQNIHILSSAQALAFNSEGETVQKHFPPDDKVNDILTFEDRMKRWDLVVRKRKWNLTGLTGVHKSNSLQYFFLNKQEITISPQKKCEHT